MELKDTSAVVTGAASGLGEATARALAALAGRMDPVEAQRICSEAARVVARAARQQDRPLAQLLRENQEIAGYLHKMTAEQLAILDDPAQYLGAAAQRTRAICDDWEERLTRVYV